MEPLVDVVAQGAKKSVDSDLLLSLRVPVLG